MFKIKRLTLYDVCEYIIAVCIILNCRSMWTTIPGVMGQFELQLTVILTFSALMCILCQNVSRKIALNALVVGIIVACYMLIFLVINPRSASSYIRLTISYASLAAYAYTTFGIRNDFGIMEKIVKLITFIASVSLVIWLIGPVLELVHPTGSVVTRWTGLDATAEVSSYYGIHFVPQTSGQLFETVLIRNSSIFTEAPMASFVFSIAFLYELFLSPCCKIKRVILLGVAIITTISTTGYVVVLIAAVLKYIISKSDLSIFKIIRIAIIPVGVIVAFNVVSYMMAEKYATSSGSIRIDDFVIGFQAWKENIFWGAGYLNEAVLKNRMGSWRAYNMGYSNSIFYLLTQGGIYLGWPMLIYPIAYIVKSIGRKRWESLCFGLLTSFMIIVTIVSYQYLTFILLLFFRFYMLNVDKY